MTFSAGAYCVKTHFRDNLFSLEYALNISNSVRDHKQANKKILRENVVTGKLKNIKTWLQKIVAKAKARAELQLPQRW